MLRKAGVFCFLFFIAGYPFRLFSQDTSAVHYSREITREDMRKILFRLASDEMEGRETGQPGQKKAAEYIASEFSSFGIPPLNTGTYLQPYKVEKPSRHRRCFLRKKQFIFAENVLGFIEGSDLKDEYVFVTAHYDHLGKQGSKIYYGADDDGSGTTSVIEIAKAFAKAKQEGHGPRRSVVCLANSGEEKGLLGSAYYVRYPVFPLSQTVADLNIDMVGRIDEKHRDDSNYVYVIGSAMLSQELHDISEKTNEQYTNFKLDYTFDDPQDPNRFYYRSDHYNFAKNNIPVIFYFNGVHEDYHQPTDTPDKIHYELMARRAQLVFLTAWELVNRDKRIVLDKKENPAKP